MASEWHYIESQTLGQTFAYDRISGWGQTRDGTRYSPAELKRITNNWTLGAEFHPPLSVHILKKVFGGTITACIQK